MVQINDMPCWDACRNLTDDCRPRKRRVAPHAQFDFVLWTRSVPSTPLQASKFAYLVILARLCEERRDHALTQPADLG
jgi:hypothetical protein